MRGAEWRCLAGPGLARQGMAWLLFNEKKKKVLTELRKGILIIAKLRRNMKKALSLVLLSVLFTSSSLFAAAISVTPASFVPSIYAVYLPGKNFAGATLLAGQAVYIDSAVTVSAGQIKLASATGAGFATQPIGFAAHGASAGQPVKVVIRDPQLTLGGAVTAGCIIYLHSTAGAVTLTAADVTGSGTWFVSVMGVGISTTKINFGGTKLNNNYTGVMRADVALP